MILPHMKWLPGFVASYLASSDANSVTEAQSEVSTPTTLWKSQPTEVKG